MKQRLYGSGEKSLATLDFHPFSLSFDNSLFSPILYTFALCVDWTAAVLHAVRKYENADNDVSVFARILRNEMDEGLRYVFFFPLNLVPCFLSSLFVVYDYARNMC